MHWLAIFAGSGLLLVLLVDVLQSTIGYGRGPLVDRVSGVVASAISSIACRWESRRLLASVGFLYIGCNFVLWVSLLWAGWALLFCGSPDAVIDTASSEPSNVWSRIYFAGYTISTLGIGDYRPNGPFWQIMTSLASLSGLVLVTFLLSVLIGLLQAIQTRRQTAIYIHHLGETPAQIVIRHLDGESCGPLREHLVVLTLELSRLEQQHRYFPVLHRFHSFDPNEDVGLALVALSEAMLILSEAVPDGPLVCPVTLQTAQLALHGFLATSDPVLAAESVGTVPPIGLQALRDAGLNVISDDEFERRASDWSDYRVRMHRIVQTSGWDWQNVLKETK